VALATLDDGGEGGGGGGGGASGDGSGVLDSGLIDSAVTAIVEGYLDSVAAHPGGAQDSDAGAVAGLPSWSAELGGLDFGIDQQWVYLAGLKIPTAVLALLPLPEGGYNYFEGRRERELLKARREIYYQARMQGLRDQFRENVRKLRARKQLEHDLAVRQRTEPGLVEDSTATDAPADSTGRP